jgi:hypothetical protein
MDQLITFHKPNKKVRIEKIMDYLIPQTKHVISVSTWDASNVFYQTTARTQSITTFHIKDSSFTEFIEIDSTVIMIVIVVDIVELFRQLTRLIGSIHH